MVELVGMVVFVAVFIWLTGPRMSQRMMPLHTAFTMTAAGILFLLTGILGYSIRKSGGLPYLQHGSAVIWPQIWWGAAALAVAAYCWRRALATLDQEHS